MNLLENTIELYKNVSIHELQKNTISKEKLKASVFKTAFAFERFTLKYGQYHLNDSVPLINNVYSKLGELKSNFHFREKFKQIWLLALSVGSNYTYLFTFLSHSFAYSASFPPKCERFSSRGTRKTDLNQHTFKQFRQQWFVLTIFL